MFRQAIMKVIESSETRENVITDGTYRCTYGELPEIFEKIDAFLAGEKLGPPGCSLLRCGNSLPEAVVLLWLLQGQRDFLLLPRAVSKEQETFEDTGLPQFCRSKLLVNPEAPGFDIKEPAAYICVTANPQFCRDSVRWRNSGDAGYVFMRTSGSTAEPKLVMHRQDKLFGNARNCVQRFELRAQDRLMIPVPIYHMYGLGAAILPGMMAGAAVNLLARTNIIRYLDREKQFKPNVSFLTPSLCEMFLQARKSSYSHRLVVTAGDRINRATFENFYGRFGRLVNLYGSTELGAIATSALAQPVDLRAEGIVEPMPGVEIRLDGSGGDGVGEILCRHEYGFVTYLDKRGSETGEVGWFRTKDLGQQVGDRQFKVMGRIDNSVNRNGILVAFSEVESIMEQRIEEVAHVVVVAAEEENSRGQKLLACCELTPNGRADGKELRSRCFDVLPRHLVPDEVRVMAEIPRLPNGKFDRKRLAGMFGRKK